MNRPGTHLVYAFDGFHVDATQRLLRSGSDGELIPLTSKAFETLLYLIEHRGELVEKATLIKAIWPNVVVEENNLSENISMLRRALGESASEHRFIVTTPGRGYRFVADVKVIPQPGSGAPHPTAKIESAGHSQSRQSVKFCRTPDGVRLAYATTGKGSPLVRVGHWLSHLEYDWDSPVYRHLLRDLSDHYELVRYDHRGNGLSDWDVSDISLEGFVKDLETVVEASGHDRFALLGMSMGGPPAITYAVRHPERLSAPGALWDLSNYRPQR